MSSRFDADGLPEMYVYEANSVRGWIVVLALVAGVSIQAGPPGEADASRRLTVSSSPSSSPHGAGAVGPRIQLGVALWVGEGRTDWSHKTSAPGSLGGDPISELTYRTPGSEIVEMTAAVRLPRRFFLRGRFGVGVRKDGLLVDDDYLSDFGARLLTDFDSSHRFSRTHSDVESGDQWYLEGELAFRALARGTTRRPRHLDLFLGYQWWNETLVASGLSQIECTAPTMCSPVGTLSFYDEAVITNEAEWRTTWLGVTGSLGLRRNFTLAGRLAYGLDARLRNEDTHHQRPDLGQAPSFRMTGVGQGLKLEMTVDYAVSKQIAVSLGYRKWMLQVREGLWLAHMADGSEVAAELSEFDTDRQGFTLGVTFRN